MGEIKSDQQEIKDVKKQQLISSHSVLCVYFLRPARLNVWYQKDCRWTFAEGAAEALRREVGGVGVQPPGTLRDEETCGLARNNKIHQVFIKLSGAELIAELLLLQRRP